MLDPLWFKGVEQPRGGDIPGWLCLGAPGRKHLSGGATTALLAMQARAHCGKPLATISTQFLAPLPLGAAFESSVQLVRAGRSFAYADGQVMCDGKLAARAQAICGGRGGLTAAVTPCPSVPPPWDCPPMPWIRCDPGDQHDGLDIRLAQSPTAIAAWPGATEGRYWVAVPPQLPMLAMIAIAADYLPEMLHMRLGQRVGAVSLDNQLRIVSDEESRWILCDAVIEAATAGVFHGHIRLFGESGNLLATGGQSGLIMPLAQEEGAA